MLNYKKSNSFYLIAHISGHITNFEINVGFEETARIEGEIKEDTFMQFCIGFRVIGICSWQQWKKLKNRNNIIQIALMMVMAHVK
jgi:hypothetical protein